MGRLHTDTGFIGIRAGNMNGAKEMGDGAAAGGGLKRLTGPEAEAAEGKCILKGIPAEAPPAGSA
jgi:hypothetical protein